MKLKSILHKSLKNSASDIGKAFHSYRDFSSVLLKFQPVSHSLCVSFFLCLTLSVSQSFCVSLFLCLTLSVPQSFCVSLFLCLNLSVPHSFCVSIFLCLTLSTSRSFCVSIFLRPECPKITLVSCEPHNSRCYSDSHFNKILVPLTLISKSDKKHFLDY
jgi:hypothetical protein